MSPRPGGEADKLGNHYEGAWTTFHLLQVLAGHADSITAESLGDDGRGVEFVVRRDNVVEAHQVKRQRGSANYWRLGDLRSEGVLQAARRHVAAGRQFHFVSTIPAQDLNDLAERARNSPDVQTFVNTLPSKTIKPNFDYMCGATVYGSPQAAWDTLRGVWVHCSSERDIRNFNAALAGLLLSGAPAPVAAVALSDLIVDSALAVPLDYQGIVDRLADYKLQLAAVTGASSSVARLVTEIRTSWKATIERELIRPPIQRREADDLAEMLGEKGRYFFAVGAGGTGKSAVLRDVVDRAEAQGWAVLAFRLDREEPFSSTIELGQRHGLGISPVPALAAVAQERDSLLVIDQLDAVSLASGRMPRTFDAIADLVREAAAFPRMRVLLACRKFDLDNDHRIRTLIADMKAQQYEIPPLTETQVVEAVGTMGLAVTQLSAQQKQLLRLPVHLKLLSSIADQDEALSFATTKDLFDAYWERKRRDCDERRQAPVRFADVVAAVVDEMSSRQRLSVPVTIFDGGNLPGDADILTSEHVLVREGKKISFFHETFFDYAFARRWVRNTQTLVDFLINGEQELFRRAQVRQVLAYLREEDQDRFVVEMEALLSEERVRYHVKDVALGLLGALPDPTAAEWHMVDRLLSSCPPLAGRLWLALRVLPWFARLDAEGALEARLNGADRDSQRRAVDVMVGGVRERPDRIAAILRPHAGHADDYPAWLRWITRFANVHESRPLFDLLLDAVRRDEYKGHEGELFMSVYDLGKQQPEWAVDLLVAFLVERPSAFAIDSSGRVAALVSRDHGAIEMVTAAASEVPRRYAEAFVPYMLQVMTVTASRHGEGRVFNRHFLYRDHEPPYHELEEALQVAAATALRRFAQEEPDAAQPLLEQLAADPHDAAQWLLFEGLTAGGEPYAEWAVSLLLDREEDFTAAKSLWAVRQLIQAINIYLSEESFARLEQAAIDYGPSWERRPRGYASFTLLSAMDEGRLSQQGRRRLGELRRLHNAEQPPEPITVTGGFLGSPIPQEAAQRMTDDQWLRAMAKHNSDKENWTTLRGDARELSQILKEEVKKEPARFARLALQLTRKSHPAYGEAIVMGLGETDIAVDPALVFETIRHTASINTDAERWLGWPLRKHLTADIPDDIIGLLLDRALQSSDPEQDSWLRESSNGDPYYRGDPLADGINTTRGSSVQMLGDLLVYDVDGHRTALVVPSLDQIARDPSVAVRACAAHLLAACLRHARAEATAAFRKLIEADDRLLATAYVERLLVYIANADSAAVQPVIRRMVRSDHENVKEAGGKQSAYVGLEVGLGELLTHARASEDASVRKGAALVCAGRLPHTANAAAAGEAIRQFFNDPDEKVREAAASVALPLRDKALRPFERELLDLIGSPAFTHTVSQLLITLEHAPDRVDDLILACARRFVDIYGSDAGDISTGAAAEAREVGELLLRAYAQASGAGARAAILDLIDSLLASGAYGVAELVEAAER